MHTSAPLPSVSAWIASTGSVLDASTVWVAPNSLASSSFRGSRSTAMIVCGAGQPGAGDGGVAHAAAAEHRDRVAPADLAGEHGGAEAGHHAAAEQPGDLRLHVGGRPSCTGRRRRASSRRTRRCRAPATASTPSSVIFCVALWVEKQYQGRPRRHERHSPHTARQLRITKSPGRHVGDVGADGLDDARRLVAEQEREVVVDAALPVVQVGVAHAARLHLHERLARARDRARRSSRP